MKNKIMLGLMCAFFGEFGVHNFMEKEKKIGIINIIISLLYFFAAIGLLLLTLLTIGLFSYVQTKNYNISYISREEAYLAPKLFEKGTGFWDGTKKYENIVLDTETGLPAEFYAPAVSDLKITGKDYIDSISKYGTGGYVVVQNTTNEEATFYSYPTTFTTTGNYTVTIKPHELEGYNEGELAQYAVYLKYTDPYNGMEQRILLKDYSKDYFEYTIDISYVLKLHGLNEVDNASVEFKILPSLNHDFSYVMFKQILFNANGYVNNYEILVNEISIVDANKSLLLDFNIRGEKQVGYWGGTVHKTIHSVEVIKCSFTYDTYEQPYGNTTKEYSFSDLEVLRKKGYCDYDVLSDGTLDLDSFVVINEEKCAIKKLIDATYLSVPRKRVNTVTCEVNGYLSYTHGTDNPVYSQAPKFILGTDQRGFDILTLLVNQIFVTLTIILVILNVIYILLILIRKIIYICKGFGYLIKKNNAKHTTF